MSEKLSASLLDTEKSESTATQTNWIVPTKPGADGTMTPIPNDTRSRKEAYTGIDKSNEISRR